ncbi:hypothetical protein JTE90_016590 [Oedothorax gibbosus]|uniref:Uncharacterized protein n=1 Tax=Oedothorax gibbosus TaxID=931172 RepID=A0AAV6TQG7_9ARAC|nr:hypothetical protein JTE90_016590 [Oedothorax gibbosus]
MSLLIFVFHSEDDTLSLPCVSSDVDQYLDEVLARARAELPDPLRLPPRSSVVELSDGLLWGLSNITRLGEAEVSCEGDDIRIKAVITSDEIKGRYTWRKKKPGRDWEGYVVFISNDFQAEVEGVMEKREGGQKSHPRLERFRIKKFKDARVEMTGLGYITWALGEMTTLMSGIFQRAIASAIQGPLKEALERHMRELEIQRLYPEPEPSGLPRLLAVGHPLLPELPQEEARHRESRGAGSLERRQRGHCRLGATGC